MNFNSLIFSKIPIMHVFMSPSIVSLMHINLMLIMNINYISVEINAQGVRNYFPA